MHGLGAACGALGGALACFALIRRWRDTFPTRGKAYGWMLCVGTLADFALIRRFAPPSPPGGRLRSVVQHFQAIPLSHTYKSALSLTTRNCRSSLPPGGEGGAKRRMRAKSASGTTLCDRLAVVAFLFKKKGFFQGFCCFMWYLSAMEIPPAGAPLGAGFDCAAMVGGRA